MPDGAAPAPPDHAPPRITEAPSARAEREQRSQRLLLLTIRLIFIVLLVTVSLLPFVGRITEPDMQAVSFVDYIGPFLATVALGVIVILVDTATPNKRLSSVFGIYLGIVAGLVAGLAIGTLVDLVAESWELNTTAANQAYLGLAKVAIVITCCYLAVSIVLTTKDDFRLVIPYVEFARQVRGVRPLVLDTSALIDGRIEGLGRTGIIDAPLIVPQFVIDELQALSDSSDKLKRTRGRRGLSVLSRLQADPFVDVSIDGTPVAGHSVDHKLLDLTAQQHLRLVSSDFNLLKVAEIRGLSALNLNEVANALKSHALPGEVLHVELVKAGEAAEQGVGYLPDGTMVVVEDGAGSIGQSIDVTVTNALQTAAGRMIFARAASAGDRSTIARASTEQPPVKERPERTGGPGRARSSRNPRRSGAG